MLRDARIGVYQVGGRGGITSLPLPPIFGADTFDVYFEADETAIAQMQARNDPATSRIFPYCLGERDGAATFYLNYDPFTSSLLPRNDDFDFTSWSRRDYPHAEAMHTIREVPLQLRSLDGLDLLADPAVAPPTAMFLDTQGTELAILKGGRALIGEHTVAIVTEAEFAPYYRDQPLFGDLCAWLGEMGFVFVDFADGPVSVEPFRTPFGQRGRSMLGHCDALFFRRIEALARTEHLMQLAFLALQFEHLAFGLRCLDRIVATGRAAQARALPHTYAAFVFDVGRARDEMPVLYPATFADLFPTAEASHDRFDPRVSRVELDRRAMERTAFVQQRLAEQGPELTALVSLGDLPIEATFRRYGFARQADAIKARRLRDLEEMLGDFGITIQRSEAGTPTSE
jgi:FkbM family methyltransferase